MQTSSSLFERRKDALPMWQTTPISKVPSGFFLMSKSLKEKEINSLESCQALSNPFHSTQTPLNTHHAGNSIY